MRRPVEASFQDGILFLKVRLYMDIRMDRAADMRNLIIEGVKRIQKQSPYEIDGVCLPVRMEIIEQEKPSWFSVNLRVYENLPVVRKRYLPWCNVSRVFMGSGRAGVFKLMRRLFKIPDVFINLGGRELVSQSQREIMESVIQHEFGHIFGFSDKYNYRTMQKRKIDVQDSDIMFRTGQDQRFMEYQIKHLVSAAKRGRLPYTQI